MPQRDEIVVGLDLGTTKVCAVVAERTEDNGLAVLGVGTAAHAGVRHGMVVSIEETGAAIARAVADAEAMSQVEIRSVITGISGTHLKGINNRNMVAVKGSGVTSQDLENVLEAVAAVELSRDEEIIHVTPQRYILDGQDTISDPVGLAGDRLTVEAHLIVGTATASQNLLRCIQLQGLSVDAVVPQTLASARAVLSPEELELGVALVDIGGGTTDLAVFAGGSVCHTWVLPLGGGHVTADISHGLSTPLRDAERIKIQFGTALISRVQENELLEVPGVASHAPRDVSRRLLAEITEARMEEILELVTHELDRTGLRPHVGSGLVLTGGGSLPDGTVELAQTVTGLPTRRGVPVALERFKELAGGPQHATAVGLAHHGLDGAGADGVHAGDGAMGRMVRWLKEMF